MNNLQSYEYILNFYLPALQTFLAGLLISGGLYLLTERLFRITGIEKYVLRIFGQKARIGKDSLSGAIGKYIAIFVFLLFLRSAVEQAGYAELNEFLSKVVNYLPHLLLALLITFFGIQSSGTAYNIIYNAVKYDSTKTAALLGNAGRVIILFFTFSITLGQINYRVEIIPAYLVISIMIGAVAAATIAFGIAFGLGGKEAASRVISDFLMKNKPHAPPETKSSEKNLKK